jgi:cytochrome P450
MVTAIVNTLYLLIKYPTAMAKLQAEIDSVLGGDEVKQVGDLKYLRACIDEAMRDRPSTCLGLPRKVPPRVQGSQVVRLQPV